VRLLQRPASGAAAERRQCGDGAAEMLLQCGNNDASESGNASGDASGILYTWYKAVQDGMYWYEPVSTLLDTRQYEKPQNGTDQYTPT
jgi:hypothetical protein